MTHRDDPPRSFQDSLEARLTGLALILGGCVGLGIVYLLWLFAPATMPAPPGLPRDLLPLTSPLNCMLPVVGIGSSALVLIGLRKLILGD
jgi:hypothetical protein